MSSAFALIWSLQHGIPLVISVMFALAVACLLGAGCNKLVYERMRHGGNFSNTGALIAGLALLLFLQGATLALFGSSTQSFTLADTLPTWNVAGALVSAAELLVIGIGGLALIALILFLKKTRMGIAMRAVADHDTVAQTIGINATRIRMLAFLIGSFYAGIGGILFLLRFSIEPSMSTIVAVRVFARAVIGGVGSLGGAVVATFAIDIIENIGAWYVNSAFKDVFAFGVAFLILLIKPHGIFGKKK